MFDWLTSLILVGVGLLAGFLNVMAGGGSTLSVPVLILLGLDPSVANGTNRVAIFLQNISAIVSFKNEKFSEFRLSAKLAVFTLPGGIIGSLVAVKISDELFQTLLAVVMIGVVISMLLPKRKKKALTDTADKPGWLLYLAMFGIGFYGGFIQVGVGFLLMAAIHYLLNVTLVHVNMHKVFIVFFYTLPALIVFMISDNVDYILGLSLAVGNSLGGWWAAKVQVKKGESIIRYILVIAIIIMSLKLLGIF